MIPETLPTALLDRAMHALGQVGEMVIQMEMQLEHTLDVDRLGRALDLVMDVHPVLGCRLDLEQEMGCWRRLPKSDRRALVEVEDREAYDRVRSAPLDLTRGPVATACLWHSRNGDRLLLRVAHEVADAGAVKQIATLLSNLYARLTDEPDLRPEPELTADREIEQLRRLIPVSGRLRILGRMVGEGLYEAFGARYQMLDIEPAGNRGSPEFLVTPLNHESTERIIERGREHGATVNDMLLTAFLRALARTMSWNGEKALAAKITFDLRRHLPRGSSPGLCNLSGIEGICLGRRLEDRFDQTLERVSSLTSAGKRGWLGMNVAGSPVLGMLRRMPQAKLTELFTKRYGATMRKGKIPPTLTNTGVIADVDFDKPPGWARILIPPLYPPAVAFGLSGHAGTLCMCTVAYPVSRASLEKLMRAIARELGAA